MFLYTFGKSSVILSTTVLLGFSTAHVFAGTAATSGNTKEVQKSGSITHKNSSIAVTGRLSLGLLNGEANEIVYNLGNGGKLSHLEWQLDNVLMLGAGISVTPTSWLKINGDIWVDVSDGDGSMDDYDWFVPGQPWTDWSSHDDMTVDQIVLFDLNAEVPLLKQPDAIFFGIVGFKHDNFGMSARGGNYVYTVNTFRDTTGSFQDGVQNISYEQTYIVPYLGIGFEADYHPLTFTGKIIGSALVDLEAEDTHYLRDLVFKDDFETGSMVAVDVGISYSFSDRLHLMGGFHYQYYDEVKGSTTITDLSTGEVYATAGDSAGADNTSSIIMTTLIYNL